MESAYDHHYQQVGVGSDEVIGNMYITEPPDVLAKFLAEKESMDQMHPRRPYQKFQLFATEQVLQSSIAKMDDFSADKASIGFEAINRYANNLLRQPCSREYKLLKTHSGFYQHQIVANLADAEAMFEAMGYRMLPDQTKMVLDGLIFPHRIRDVARDAILAKAECQMMKMVFDRLTDMKLTVNWTDIYSYRELNRLSVEQTVQNMAMLIQEKQHNDMQAYHFEFN